MSFSKTEKPTSSWSVGVKPVSGFSTVAKPTGAFSIIAKPAGAFSKENKPFARNYLLLQTDDYFLLQTGYKIILEDRLIVNWQITAKP